MTAFTTLDTNHNVTAKLAALKAMGIDTVIRYIMPNTANEKVVKPAEARAFAAAGMKLAIVYEINGTPSGANQGGADGEFAFSYMPTIGAPDGAIIWYAVDYDPSPAQMQGVIAAFTAFKATLGGRYAVGCYGSGYCCDTLFGAGLITGRWITCSMGFRGSRESIAAGRCELIQKLPQTIAGLDTDPDVVSANGAAGGFIPSLAPPGPPDTAWPPTDPAAVEWVQAALNAQGTTPPLGVDGGYGPLTRAAVIDFQTAHDLTADGKAGPATVGALKGVSAPTNPAIVA